MMLQAWPIIFLQVSFELLASLAKVSYIKVRIINAISFKVPSNSDVENFTSSSFQDTSKHSLEMKLVCTSCFV